MEALRPWDLLKAGKTVEVNVFLDEMVAGLRQIAHWLETFLPDTAGELRERLAQGRSLRPGAPLFPRLA